MKKILMALAASLLATSAFAADLPSKKLVVAPAPYVETAFSAYLGLNGGYGIDTKYGSVGAQAGYEFNSYIRGEVTYDHLFGDRKVPFSGQAADAVAGNIIAQYTFGSITPYVLGGVGYRWDSVKDQAIYNVGGGVRYALSNRVELDARYRYVNDFDNRRHDSLITAGVNVKF